MDFTVSGEQADLRESIIKFARQELNGEIESNVENCLFPIDSWRKCGAMRIMGLPFPEKYGGCGLDFLTTAISIQALGYACRDAGLVHAVTTQILCGLQISLFGDEKQKDRYIPAICSGEMIFAQAITESSSGSDAMSMRTRGERNGDAFILNGRKIFISNGPIADAVIVYALTSPEKKTLNAISSFIVEKSADGFERCRPFEKMGLSTLQNGELVFDNCSVPQSALLGKEGQGAIIFNESMEWERCLLPAAHLGTLERIVETCVRYAKERSTFGQPIGKYQAVSTKIADMKINLELGKLIMFKTATLKDKKKRSPLEASIGKLFISESLKRACLDAVQIHGGYGYMKEYEIERDLRDSISATIYSGTSEMQYQIITKLIGL